MIVLFVASILSIALKTPQYDVYDRVRGNLLVMARNYFFISIFLFAVINDRRQFAVQKQF